MDDMEWLNGKDWENYVMETVYGTNLSEDELFNKVYDDLSKNFLNKVNLAKSMRIINKNEDSPISEQKIANYEINQDVTNGKLKPFTAKQMIIWNNELNDIFKKNPLFVDEIIL